MLVKIMTLVHKPLKEHGKKHVDKRTVANYEFTISSPIGDLTQLEHYSSAVQPFSSPDYTIGIC